MGTLKYLADTDKNSSRRHCVQKPRKISSLVVCTIFLLVRVKTTWLQQLCNWLLQTCYAYPKFGATIFPVDSDMVVPTVSSRKVPFSGEHHGLNAASDRCNHHHNKMSSGWKHLFFVVRKIRFPSYRKTENSMGVKQSC